MVFYPPAWTPKLNDTDIPDNISLGDFVFSDRYRSRKCKDSPSPFIECVDGTSYTVQEAQQRIEWLAAGLTSRLKIGDLTGDVWDRVISIFAVNNIHTPVITWATHRLNGVVAPVNAAFQASELAFQLKDSRSQCLFTSASHLETALEAAKAAGIPESRVFLIPIPSHSTRPAALRNHKCLSLDDLIDAGRRLPPLPRTKWSKGQGRRQPAYVCYSSGTSGAPKGVIISHFNVIANILQHVLYELHFRPHNQQDVILGVLPQSHIYSIVLAIQVPAFRGDSVIVMPKFELMNFVQTVKKYQATFLYVVPPILIALAKQTATTTDPSFFNLPSVKRIFCGAAPLSEELTLQIRERYPGVLLGQGYGMTEAPTVIASHPAEVYDGAAGCLIVGMEARIVDPEGREITELNTPGELFVKGPNIALGYYKNEKATKETFSNGWLRTGDEVEMRLHPETKDAHMFIVDRVKELIKVSGFQVAPAELEGHLLGHPLVADCAVIPVPSERSGEVPKALVVLEKSTDINHEDAAQQLLDWVAQHKSKPKHLRGGVEFISEIPKSPSGKILRRFLRDRERRRLTELRARL